MFKQCTCTDKHMPKHYHTAYKMSLDTYKPICRNNFNCTHRYMYYEVGTQKVFKVLNTQDSEILSIFLMHQYIKKHTLHLAV